MRLIRLYCHVAYTPVGPGCQPVISNEQEGPLVIMLHGSPAATAARWFSRNSWYQLDPVEVRSNGAQNPSHVPWNTECSWSVGVGDVCIRSVRPVGPPSPALELRVSRKVPLFRAAAVSTSE